MLISVRWITKTCNVSGLLKLILPSLTVLDPYALNIFPKSLLPTAVYITILAVLGWFVSDIIWKWLASAVEEPQAGQSANPQIAKRGIEEEKKRR